MAASLHEQRTSPLQTFDHSRCFMQHRLKAEMNFRTPKDNYLDFSKFSAFSRFLVLVDSNRSNWTRRAEAVADC